MQGDVDLHSRESQVVRHGLHLELHESLLPHDSDLSPRGSHLPKFEKHAAMACQLHSVLLPSQGLHLVEHVGWLQGLQPLPPDVSHPLCAQLLDLLTFAAQETTQVAERSNRSSNDSTADTGLHDRHDC